MPGNDANVALLFRGDSEARALPLRETRFALIADALARVGITPLPAVFSEGFADDVYRQLLSMDSVLVWVNPSTPSGDRTVLDQLLRDVAGHGVLVSAHPDTIIKMGTKEVLFTTRTMGWGCDTRLYRTLAEMRAGLPDALASGARVLKQHRGNGGDGVFKVERDDAQSGAISGTTPLRIRHARRGGAEQAMPLDEFIGRCTEYFEGAGRMIDQPWQSRLPEGMIRCYVVHDRVAGFGEQLINALYPPVQSGSRREFVEPGPRLYYPSTRQDLQPLKHQLESEWIPEMQRQLGVTDDELPVVWDADFLYGDRTPAGVDSYVLCEINVSSVFPFPDEVLDPLAQETLRRLTGRN